jgi:hypothetical protein
MGKKSIKTVGYPLLQGGDRGLTQLSADALQIFRVSTPVPGHFRHGDMDFLAIPQHPQLLEHFDLLQRARRPADIAANKAGAIAINADMTQQRITDGSRDWAKRSRSQGMVAREK